MASAACRSATAQFSRPITAVDQSSFRLWHADKTDFLNSFVLTLTASFLSGCFSSKSTAFPQNKQWVWKSNWDAADLVTGICGASRRFTCWHCFARNCWIHLSLQKVFLQETWTPSPGTTVIFSSRVSLHLITVSASLAWMVARISSILSSWQMTQIFRDAVT